MKTSKQKSRIDKIMKLIQEEADTLSGIDLVGRLYSVSRQIDDRIIILMELIRDGERNQKWAMILTWKNQGQMK